MTYIPRNAAPLNYKEGMQDNSVPDLVRTPTGDPIHKPLIFTFAARGVDNEAFPLYGDNALDLLGRSLFDLRGPYATFNTPYQAMFNANANECMYQRLVPDDAKVATVRVYADVVETQVPKYVRVNGAVQYDAAGKAKVESQVDGILVVLRSVIIDDADTTPAFGSAIEIEGTLTGTGGAKSKMYPLFDIKAPYAGADCNGFGFKLIPLNEKSSPALTSSYQEAVSGRVYSLQWFETLAGVTSPVIWKTLTSMSSINFSFKPDAYYQPMRTQLDFEVVVADAYRKTTPDVGALPNYGPFEAFHVYHDELLKVLELAQSFVNDAPTDPYLIDIFGGLDLNGQPYDGFQLNPATETGKTVFSSNNTLFLQGGSDGTLGDAAYDELVKREMLLFPDSGKVSYDNELKYSLGCFWDSGFSFDTKAASVNFIGKSRNTFLTLCTHVYDQGRNDLQAEESAKIALIELITSVPESAKFGTPAARGLVTGQTALIRGSSYKKAVPMNYSLANMFSKYLGASEGRANPANRFSRGELTVITDLTDLSMPWKGMEVYASDWDVSLVTARSYDYYRDFIPAIQSIYDQERSVLNNALFNFIMTYAYRVSDRVWADMSGESRMTNDERAKMIQNKIIERLDGRLDGIADITPTAYFTAEDISNGYSVSLDLLAYGGVLLTQVNTTIKVYRRES